jgi:stage II sporulation protein D
VLRTLLSIALALLASALHGPIPAWTPVGRADAAVRHVVRGAGFGHGIGMSQYGAYGYALQGAGYEDILAHYYSGTQLGRAPSRPVRVLLQPDDPYIRFRGASSANGASLSPDTTYVARRSGSGVALATASGKRVDRVAAPLQASGPGSLRLLGPAVNGVSNGLYRGAIEVLPDGGGVTAINVLDLDQYVKGVVAGEMSSSWPLEALKVQAIAARTYALATAKSGGAFDLYPDTRSQVYRGVIGESVRSNAAVDQTAGRIVTYGGEPAVTYYFSTSGGYTESIEYSFIGSLAKPWLVGVPDPYDDRSPYHRWQASFSTATLTRALGARGTFERLNVLQRGVSPRVVRARVVGSAGSTTITGPEIRSRLGLRDTWMTFVRVSSTTKRPRSAASAGRARARQSRVLDGEFWPAPRSHRLLLELLVGDDWRKLTAVRTTRAGRYRALVSRPGVYRVRSGSVAGPRVRLR